MAERAIASRGNRLWPWLAASLAGHGLLLAAWQQAERLPPDSDSLTVSIELIPAPKLAVAKPALPTRQQLVEAVEPEPVPTKRIAAKKEKLLAKAELRAAPVAKVAAESKANRQVVAEPVATESSPMPEKRDAPMVEPASVQLARAEAPAVDSPEIEYERVNRLVRDHLESFKFYPGGARRRGLEGHVDVAFTLVGSGLATAVTVLEGSGHDILDRAALETVSRAQPFPVERGSFRFRLNFRRL